MNAGAALLGVLRSPATMTQLSLDEWDLLLRQAVGAGLAGRLGALAIATGAIEQLDPRLRSHLTTWYGAAQQQRRSVRWELQHLTRDLADLPGPLLLLKGAAYAAADLPPAAGRMFSDIDLMVPRDQLEAAEAALLLGGWHADRLSAYDLRYYRRWMHELPPLRHLRRLTVLDVHHSILPPTARIKTRPEPILEAATPLAQFPRFRVPSRCDLVLHSAAHLFHEGEWQHGLRDVVDIDALIRSYAPLSGFWDQLLERARELNFGRPLYYALRCCTRLLATPVPDDVLGRCPGRPPVALDRAMVEIFVSAMGSAHRSLHTAGTRSACAALYVRSHWLRMPPRLLLPHLTYKAWQDHVEPLFERKPAAVRNDAPR